MSDQASLARFKSARKTRIDLHLGQVCPTQNPTEAVWRASTRPMQQWNDRVLNSMSDRTLLDAVQNSTKLGGRQIPLSPYDCCRLDIINDAPLGRGP